MSSFEKSLREQGSVIKEQEGASCAVNAISLQLMGAWVWVSRFATLANFQFIILTSARHNSCNRS